MKSKFSKFINLQGKYLTSLLILLTLCIGNVWGAPSTKTYNFDDNVALSTDWDVSTDVPSGGEAVCEITNSLSGAGFSAQDGKYLGLAYKNKSNIGITIISKTSYTNISNVTFKAVAGDNSKPTFAAYIVTSEGDVELFAAVGSKDGFATGGTNKWGSKSTDLATVKTGKLKIVTTASSSGKYAAIDDIVITYTSGGGETPVCPSGLTISSKNNQVDFTEGEKIELTAALSDGNGTITYQWYKGSVASGNEILGATTNKLTINSCVVADAGDYFCVASKTSCSDAVNASAFAITVEADPKCFNMPAITSKPSNLASVTVTGGSLADVSVNGKSVSMDANGLKFGGNDSRLKVTLTGASIVDGTKITVAYKGASTDGSGVGIFDENCANQTLNATGLTNAGSVSHTFTAAEAANYADEFIINRNGTGKSICVNAITVEDCGPAIVKHTITLNYNDGATPNGSITVVDGNAAVKPSDPTRGKYTFLGWYVGDTDNAYVWSDAVTDDIILKAHWQDPWTITFSDGEAAGASSLDVASITVKHNTVTDEKPADPTWAAHDFNGWTEGGVAFDWTAVITANHTLVAEWITPVAKYDVEYYDGETKLGTEEQVRADQHPTASGIATARPLYTFVGWFTSSALSGDPVDLDDVTPVEGLKLYGKWAKAYASNADFEAYIIANNSEKDDADKAEAYVKSLNYALSTKTNTTFDANNSSNNGAYAGLKIKNPGTVLSWNVVAGKVVELKAGVMVASGSLAINSGTPATIDGGSTGSGDNFKTHYFYSATEALYEFTTSNGSAEVIKAITMRDPYTVSFEAHGDADPTDLPGQPSVILPTPTNGTASLLGWFTAETGGTKVGDAGDPYTPTANITLHAQWETVSTDARLSAITFSSNAGTLSPAFDPEEVNYTYTMPYPTAEVPTIVSATSVNANAQASVIDAQAANWGDVAQIHGVAQSGDTKNYYITMQMAPKDGAVIIGADMVDNGGTAVEGTNHIGAYYGDVTAKLKNLKVNSAGYYIGLQLAAGQNFHEGDVLNLHTTTAATQGKIEIYEEAEGTNLILATDNAANAVGDNKIVLTSAFNSYNAIYVVRKASTGDQSWNGYVDHVEVTRPMNPVLTAISFTPDGGEAVAATEGTSNTFSATLPNGTVLADMTVTPTIVWNGAGTAEPTAAWAWGDNTFRVTDKDGDYTDYTITLTEAASPSAAPVITTQPVGANYTEGAAIAALEVVATGSGDLSYQWYLGDDAIDGATTASYTPIVSAINSYVYHCVVTNTEAGHPATSLASNNATITISEDPAAIKLIVAGAVNTTDFITGVEMDENPITIASVDYDCAHFGSSTSSGIVNATGAGKFIIYNARTTQTKIKLVLYNTNSSSQQIVLQKLLEGAAATEDVVIDVPSKEYFETAYMPFNNAAHRTMYLSVKNTNIKVLQVKVVDDGTALKQAGEAGYSLNLNLGRPFLASAETATFEGLTINPGSNYKVLNSTEVQTAENISFTVASPVTMTLVSTGAKYQVSTNDAGEGDEFAAGTNEHSLTAGTWYIHSSTGSNMKFTNIAFSAPKCAEPSFAALANSDICDGDPYVALDGTATVADAGVPTYQWYNADGDAAIEGATNATFTPSADGSYYVIATNHLADHSDNIKQSATVTVTTFASAQITTAPVDVRQTVGEDATLTVVASGKAPLSYQWYTCDNADGDNPVIITGEEDASYTVNVTANMDQYYKVVVSSGCGEASAVARIVEWVALPQLNVSASTTWDWANAGENIKLDGNTTPAKNEECVMANVKVGGKMPTNDDTFNSQALLFYGENVRNVESGRAYASIGHIKFTTTVAGKVTVEFSDNGNNNRKVKINDALSESSSSKTDVKTFSAVVPAGVVNIEGVKNDGTGNNQYIRISKIIFSTTDMEGADYTRDVTSGRYGTICLPNAGIMVGAAIFEIAYMDYQNDKPYKIYFDEIISGEMVAGRPYIFLPNDGASQLGVYYTDDANAAAGNYRGLYGSYERINLTANAGNYILKDNKYYYVNSDNVYCGENRAYIKLAEVADHDPGKPAFGHRRVSMGFEGEQVATDIENIQTSEGGVQKLMINGELFILRGEKLYDATGRLVK